MGRNTYEKVLTFGEWPYEGKRVVVLSRTLTADDLPRARGGDVELHPGPVPELIQHLRKTGAKHAYIDGGKVSFLAEARVDEMTITWIPRLIGSGIPLFGTLDRDIVLEHVNTVVFGNGYVQSTYRL